MNVLGILNQIGYSEVRDCGTHYRTKPLYRDSGNSTSLSVDKNSGRWYDFSQRIGGNIVYLAQLTLSLPSFKDAEKMLFGENTEEYKKVQNHVFELGHIKKFDRVLVSKLEQKHEYWLNRGISLSTIKEFGGGVTDNGKMSNRYVFPIFNARNELVGFSGRLLFKSEKAPKWKHLGQKTHWCYPCQLNTQEIQNKKQVIIVESIGDMLALWDIGVKNVVVTFGLSLGVEVLKFLLRMSPKEIIIALNNDEDNAFAGNIAAEDMKNELVSYFDPSQIKIALPDSKDFGEMSPEERLEWKQKYLNAN